SGKTDGLQIRPTGWPDGLQIRPTGYGSSTDFDGRTDLQSVRQDGRIANPSYGLAGRIANPSYGIRSPLGLVRERMDRSGALRLGPRFEDRFRQEQIVPGRDLQVRRRTGDEAYDLAGSLDELGVVGDVAPHPNPSPLRGEGLG